MEVTYGDLFLPELRLRTRYTREWSLILSDWTPEAVILLGVFVIQRSIKDLFEVLVTLVGSVIS